MSCINSVFSLQIAVATFANQGHSIQVDGEPCFTEQLAYATTQTKAKFRDVLVRLDMPCGTSRSCSRRSTSRYSGGLWKAFDLLLANDGIHRERTYVRHQPRV